MSRYTLLRLAACLVALGFASSASAQAPWTRLPSDVDQVAVEAYWPGGSPAEYATLSSYYIVSRRTTLIYRLQATVDFPLGYANRPALPLQRSRTTLREGVVLGNPYLAVTWPAGARFEVETGVRVPVVKHTSGTLVGARGTTMRSMAFTRNHASVQTLARFTHAVGRGFSLALRAGPELILPSDTSGTQDVVYTRRTTLQYSAQGWYETTHLAVGMGVHGRGPTGWSHQEANVSLVGKIGRLRPGIVLRRLMNDGSFSEGRTVVGLTLGLTTPSTE